MTKYREKEMRKCESGSGNRYSRKRSGNEKIRPDRLFNTAPGRISGRVIR